MEEMGKTGASGGEGMGRAEEVDRLLRLGAAYCMEGLLDNGLECYTAAIGLDPSRAESYVSRGGAYLSKNMPLLSRIAQPNRTVRR